MRLYVYVVYVCFYTATSSGLCSIQRRATRSLNACAFGCASVCVALKKKKGQSKMDKNGEKIQEKNKVTRNGK